MAGCEAAGYIKRQESLIEHFVAGAMAGIAASLVGVNKSTRAKYFHRLREIIDLATEDETPLTGEVEVDERYFGGRRKGCRRRGAAGKCRSSAFQGVAVRCTRG